MDLTGKNILFLGSSVTYGSAAGGVSFADILCQQTGAHCIKEAVSGTTLADIDEESYVARLKKVDPATAVDLLICQLSTNDASSKRIKDVSQTEDAIRFILEYAKTTFRCPIVFYTGTYFESEKYAAMVKLLYDLQKEYDFHILDLYNDEAMLSVSKEQYAQYMSDHVHPTLLGYEQWWTPKFVEFCKKL